MLRPTHAVRYKRFCVRHMKAARMLGLGHGAGTKRSANQNVQRVEVSAEELNNVRTLFHRSPVTQMCRNMLSQYLFRNKVMFHRGDITMKVGATLDVATDEFWIPFSEQCVDAILTAGVVVCDIIDHHTEPGVPVVVPDTQYRLYSCTVGSSHWFEAESIERGGGKARYYIVLNDFGSDPNTRGQLTSRISTLYNSQRWIRSMCDLALDAEHIRTAPTLLTQQRHGPRQDVAGLHTDQFCNADLVVSHEEDKFRRDEVALEQLRVQEEAYESMRLRDPGGKHKREMPNMFCLPSDQELARQPVPESRTDLVPLIRLTEEQTCAVMGVPRSLLYSDSARVGVADHSSDTMRVTLDWWKRQLTRILSQMYQIVYGKSDAMAVIKQTAGKGMTLRDIMDKNVVTVSFPTQVTATIAELKELYQCNVISWETFNTSCLRVAGVDATPAYDKDPEGTTSKKRREGGSELY